MCTTTNGLEFYNACYCAGTGCGGHLKLTPATLAPGGWTPIGWQGAAQHAYTMACDGLHAPGPCPPAPGARGVRELTMGGDD